MNWASQAWRAALAALFAVTAWQVYRLRDAPAWFEKQIAREGEETRRVALGAIADTRRDLLREVAALRKDTMQRVDDAVGRSDAAIRDATERADERLRVLTETADARLREMTGVAAGLRSDVQPILQDARNLTSVASENADLLGRCATQDPETGEWIGNPDCFANRVIPALKNVEHMAGAGERMFAAVEKETPETAVAVRQTSQNVSKIVDRFARPTSWVKGVAFTAARAVGRWFGF